MLREKVGRWLHFHTREAKAEMTSELVKRLDIRWRAVALSSDEEDEEDDSYMDN